jgi:alcohol dehydrogenase class IV
LRQRVGAAPRLGALGMTEELVPTLVADALADVVLVNSPRQPAEDELAALLRGLL